MSTEPREILERRLGLALDFQGSLAADLKQMRAWRNKWRTRTREYRDRAAIAEATARTLRCELATATASLGSAQAVTKLQAEAADLRRQKADLEAALGVTMTAWRKDITGRDALAATLRVQLDAAQRADVDAHAQLDDAHAKLDVATKRADLAEATLESVRAAVAKPVEDKQDGRPKVGDAVPWAEVEAGALYYREPHVYPFCMVVGDTFEVMTGTEDEDLEPVLRGDAWRPLSSLCTTAPGVLVARDLGTDPEAWRAAMREHMAKVGK